jgi:hypothetical protein
MADLFWRILSQALQAFMPIAVVAVWLRHRRHAAGLSGVRWGVIASLPGTVAAASLFRDRGIFPEDEAILALGALVSAVLFLAILRRRRPGPDLTEVEGRSGPRLAFVAAIGCAFLLIVRQTMETGLLLWVVLDQRLRDPMLIVVGAALIGAAAAMVWARVARVLPASALERSTRAFTVAFALQAFVYVVHEAAEAGWLPLSELLHVATEPFGPDGYYGVRASALLLLVPAAAAGWPTGNRLGVRSTLRTATVAPRPAALALGLTCLVLAGAGAASSLSIGTADSASPGDEAVAKLASRPHLLFRETGRGIDFGKLSIAPLDAPESVRIASALSCERLSFAAEQGLCLFSERRLFTSYKAVLFDRQLRPGKPLKLDGRPSRTRVASDGRVGAYTVFVFGDSYAAPFSTRTRLLDMASGDDIGELEQFTTWREGTRVREDDFNFWGVTFADDNLFYATLRTGSTTYLVRGDLVLRRLTILRENVECPSLSPDKRTIVFKKHVGPGADGWRLAALDLATMTDRVIGGETRYIDDQVEWLDSKQVLYAVPRRTTEMSDIWVASIDGGPSRVFLPLAESPIVVR